jgi:hypothetical protein
MKDIINDMDDFPKLVPDTDVRFEEKDAIRRAAEADFECSELEYKIRLVPDMNIVTPDRDSLRRRTAGYRSIWLAAAAAAAIIFAVIITDRHDDTPVIAENNAISRIEPVPETKFIPERETDNSMSIPERKVVRKKTKAAVNATDNSPADSVALPVQTVEMPVAEDDTAAKNIQIRQIASITVPVQMMRQEKTVFVYRTNYRQPIAVQAIIGMATAAQKLAADVSEARQIIEQKIDGFRHYNILNRLSFDRGIDREIDEWARNNPDVPFTVYIDDFNRNNVTEIFDKNGTLIRAIFFANKSIKYRNNKVYQASNT